MPQLVFPETGVSLHGAPDDEQASLPSRGKPVQVMQLDVPEVILDELVKSARGSKMATNIAIHFGRSPTLHYGNKSRMASSTLEKFRHELYTASTPDSDGELSFAGLLTHKIEVRMPERSATDSVDSAVLELQSKMDALKKEKQSKTSIYVKDGSKLPPARKIRAHEVNRSSIKLLNKGRSGLFPSSAARSSTTSPAAPSSPLLMAATSAPTSVPTLQQLQNPTLQALRTPLIHLLALGPTTLKSLSRKTRCSMEDCKVLLQKVGKEAKSGNGDWELTDRTYKELDVWNFPYPSGDDRKSAIDNAISAFDRLRLGREDKLWQLLLPRKERGKGKVLSRLGTARKQETPSNRKSQDPAEDGAGSLATSTSRAGTDVEEAARSTPQQHATKRKVSEREAMAKRLLSKNPSKKVKAPVKSTQKKITKSTKKAETSTAASRIKSAEFVEDSDSDVEMEDAPTGKATITTTTTATDVARSKSEGLSASNSVTPPEPARLSKAQANSKNLPSKQSKDAAKASGRSLPQAAAVSDRSKTALRASKDTPAKPSTSPPTTTTTRPSPPSTKTSTPKPPLQQQAMKAIAQPIGASPRPSFKEKLDNSPRKPSPLGASPPANASDPDPVPSIPSTSTSPPSSQASKGQSTPTPLPNKKSAEKRSNGDRPSIASVKPAARSMTQPQQSLKRKADEIDRRNSDRQNQLGQRREESNKRRQVQAHPTSISESGGGGGNSSSSSSVSPPPHDYYMIEKARRFKKIYRRYERLYRELSHISDDDDPPADKIKEITSMHNKLKSLKMEISRAV
ncbi:hypothetical protein GP486_007895 [Trichoglossum hirsutum]|uniref:Uncharacterized protein n=1 Tax=Trichoglossum hirsutum TaxID=265104 RepID=A0A9P8IAW2_9PEZI|nr:hypothetical protein GP486_007895 [Trichoglossum hirsutum]